MPKQITTQQARDYFELGVLAHAFILPVPMGSGWFITLEGTKGAAWHLGTARGDLREFSTLDAAVNALRAVGWNVRGLQVHHRE